jgi:hypothetical protein
MVVSNPESTVNYFTQDWGSTFDWLKKPAQSTQGKMAFDPFSLAIAGLSAGVGALSGSEQQKAANKAIEKQLQFQGDALKEGIFFQRDSAKANIALGMFGQIFGATTGAELDFGRQERAKRMELGEFMPKQMGLGREQATWQTAFEGSPLAQATARKERLGKLQERIGGFRAQQEALGMGPISYRPIESFMV